MYQPSRSGDGEPKEGDPLTVQVPVESTIQVPVDLTPVPLASVPGATQSATISVVIPAKNEERNIAWVLERIPLLVDEIILVDGHSTDRTVEIARMVRPDIRVVTESTKGKGAALRTGFAAATGDLIVLLDADCSMDPLEIDRYAAALVSGADLAKGSRYMPGGSTADMTRLRGIGNRVLLGLSNKLFGANFTELCYGYMGLRRSRLDALDLRADGFEIETEIVVRSLTEGLRVVEVPSHESERRFGASNLHAFRDGTRVLMTMLRERFGRHPRRTVEDRVTIDSAQAPVDVRIAGTEIQADALSTVDASAP